MLLNPHFDKNKRITLLAETHLIKGGSQIPNKQPSVEYPYLSIYKGKDDSPFKDFTEYKPKLHDFYARQGRFFLENPDRIKPVVPGFPDLDAGIHGHSGTYHKNGMRTGIRDLMEQGNVIQYVDGHGLTYGLYLDRRSQAMLVYDAKLAAPRTLYRSAIVDYDDYRMSTARSAKVVGDPRFTLQGNGWGEQALHFNGHYRYKKDAVFSYKVDGSELLEFFKVHGEGDESWLSQHFFFPKGNKALSYQIGVPEGTKLEKAGGLAFLSWELEETSMLVAVGQADAEDSGKIEVAGSKAPQSIFVIYWEGDRAQRPRMIREISTQVGSLGKIGRSLPSMTKGSPSLQWDHKLVGTGRLADPADFKTPYVIDTLPVPILNPYKSPMVLSGIAFNPLGEAFVSTMFGDVWKVTGLTHDLKKVVWKRMIAGLNSPFGLTYHDGALYAGDKAELIALRDLNGDGDTSDLDVSEDARLIPAVIRLAWRGPNGDMTSAQPVWVQGD